MSVYALNRQRRVPENIGPSLYSVPYLLLALIQTGGEVYLVTEVCKHPRVGPKFIQDRY